MLRRPRNITNFFLGIVVVFGFGSGYYIWEPAIREQVLNQKKISEQSSSEAQSVDTR